MKDEEKEEDEEKEDAGKNHVEQSREKRTSERKKPIDYKKGNKEQYKKHNNGTAGVTKTKQKKIR